MAYFSNFINNLPWGTIWSFVSAIATCVIGYFAYKIARAQLDIEKHKKDDFMYEHRFNAYINFINAFQNMLVKLELAKDKVSLIDELHKTIYGIEILFNDVEIMKHVNIILNNGQLLLKMSQEIIYLTSESDDYPQLREDAINLKEEYDAIAKELDKYIDNKTLQKLFEPYLILDKDA